VPTPPLADRPLRHVLIGAGGLVFDFHRPALTLATTEVVAVVDVDAEAGQRRAAELNCPFYLDHRAALTATNPDIAVVMTPHPSHVPVAIDCLQSGCHVLVEKPMAVQVAEADALIEAARQADRVLAVSFQMRHRPEVQAARALIRDGRLGLVQRADLVATWPRSTAYYRQAAWRGTWRGEGGGVVMNQAAHHLDLLCYLLGLPNRLVGWSTRRLQRIEAEDTVQAMVEWPGGAWGSIHISTAEAGDPERLQITGTGGRLRIIRGVLAFERFEPDLRDYARTSPKLFGSPAMEPVEVELGSQPGDHAAVYHDLHQALLHGAPLTTDGPSGRMSLEVANAIILASHTGAEVALPLDRERYAALYADLAGR
jgi:predicted dehydrogenase